MTQIRLPLLNGLFGVCRLLADLLCCLPAEDPVESWFRVRTLCQTPHLVSEDTSNNRAITESKCLTSHPCVGGGRVNSSMWLLFGHRAGCDKNQLVLVFDALAV